MIGTEDIRVLAEKYGTPGYIFDIDELNSRVDMIEEALGTDAEVVYAMKANPFLLRFLKDRLNKFEVCSPGEFAICESEYIPMENIVLSGVNKEKCDIRHTMELSQKANPDKKGCGIYTIESMNQLKLIEECAGEAGIKADVLIRVTSGNQFGLNESDIYEIVNKCSTGELKNIHIEGIQLYSGTQKKKLSQIENELVWLMAIASKCEQEYGLKLKEIEYGPGLSVEYFKKSKGEDTDVVSHQQEIADLEEFAQMLKPLAAKYKVTLEMGRFVAASCGMLVSRIADMKYNNGQRYAIIDSGINHINYYGQAMAMKMPEIEVIQGGNTDNIEPYARGEQAFTLCGSLCTVADVIVKNYPITDAAVGDILIFKNLGAYSVTEGIYLFLSRRMPVILAYSEKSGVKVLRDAVETYMLNGGR